MSPFEINSEFSPKGDQKEAINNISNNFNSGMKRQTLLGVTGSGKTFTMASVISEIKRPALVIAHNKTLAAQLATEFEEFLPNTRVHYFVSYYDYYQPEAYVPKSDTYIEKEADINEEIEKLRHASTNDLLTNKEVVIVASVSCIYGLGDPDEYRDFKIELKQGSDKNLRDLLRNLVSMQYERNEIDLQRGTFRVRGDSVEIIPSDEEIVTRIQFWGDEIEKISKVDPLTGEVLGTSNQADIFPAKHWVTSQDRLNVALKDIEIELNDQLKYLKSRNKLLEAQRLEQRTRFDMDLMRETGSCPGIENYSRHIGRRKEGSPPPTLLDYFPNNFVVFIDESHITLPQIRGMFFGDRSRKETLIEYGFRLPSAIDNRPLNFEEFDNKIDQITYVSATPGPHESETEQDRALQIMRPTGLLDPKIEVLPSKNQIDDLINRINLKVEKKERTLVTTLTKRMAEELSEYLIEMGIKTHYLHSEIDTLERVEILRDLRYGLYDVIVGINLLREGIDLPEVSLVAIIDADKEGFLRSSTSLIQTIGRAARHINGEVIMYADKVTKSMKYAIEETNNRRKVQGEFNQKFGITPKSITTSIKDITEKLKEKSEKPHEQQYNDMNKVEFQKLIKKLEKEMKSYAKGMEFEKAAMIRDQISELRRIKIK
ncbi:MAG: excinuclease ABC subunit B [Chloroflexi bacterium]|mgnify:CR=1 FL=1|nr:excinuclease ABC subunit B [Chloroflexota bacterium]|tara:strand:+ start:1508 stop:3478 length:1971 start_codon:yes stop_codon:yes gene_type:complete